MILTQVVVAEQGTAQPHLVDRREKVLLHRWDMDLDAGLDRTLQTLTLVAVVMRHQHIGQPVDAHLGEVIEHLPRTEVDRDAGALADRALGDRALADGALGPDHINVAAGAQPEDSGGNLIDGKHGSWPSPSVYSPGNCASFRRPRRDLRP